ncbi:MAG: nitronate monooxygenase [Pseudomonadota bacterium]
MVRGPEFAEVVLVDVCDLLSIERPVLQGAMGGIARHDLVVAVSQAGGLGTLGYLPPDGFARELERIQDSLEGRTFAANLLMPIIRKAHVEACLNSSVTIVTVFYGFDHRILSALKDAGKTVIFQVGSLAEAQKVITAGADGVIVQGFEAGGHVRGTKRLADLLPEIRDAFPNHLVCGAGGIHDKQSADACRALGADAVCSGTRFLASPEASAHRAYTEQLSKATETIVTNLFGVGWRDPHRVIPNAATRKWCRADGREPPWLPMVHAGTRIASRLRRADGAAKMTARQSLSAPLYTPASLTPEMDAALLDVVALYAGECTRWIDDVQPAARTVQELS